MLHKSDTNLNYFNYHSIGSNAIIYNEYLYLIDRGVMVRKLPLMLLALSSASSFAHEEISATLSGQLEVHGSFRHQKNLPDDQKNISANKRSAINTESNVRLDLLNKKNEFDYGAQIILQPTSYKSSSGNVNGTHLFTEGKCGRLEVGAPYGSAYKMNLTAYSLAKGPGDIWSTYANLNPGNHQGIEFKTDADPILDNIKGDNEATRKISYYTPKFNGFQLGMSFTPDTANTANLKFNDTKSNRSVRPNGYKQTGGTALMEAKNGMSLGVSYEHEISDGMAMQVGMVSEYAGDIVQKDNANNSLRGDQKLSKLKTLNIGAMLNCGNFSVAGSYGDHFKSFTAPAFDGTHRNSKFYTLGGAYENGPVGASLVYLNSDHRKNKLHVFTLGTDYKLAPGLVPFAEVSYFNTKGKYLVDTTNMASGKTDKRRGTVLIIGTKLKF